MADRDGLKKFLTRTLTEQQKTLIIIGFASALYFPLVFLGYGSHCDSHLVINTAQTLIEAHKYVPSRTPGYFVHEASTALLFMLGGSLLTNLGTMAMSLLTIYFFIKTCGYHSIPHRHLLAILLIIHPLYWVNSTCTIDYVWALALILIGYTLWNRKNYVGAGVLLGLSIGTRLSSILFVIAFAVSSFLTRETGRKEILLTAIISIGIGALLYIPSFVWAGYSLRFLTYAIGDWDWIGYLARFVYKNIYFWGLQTALALLFLAPWMIKRIKRDIQSEYKDIVVLSILVIVSFEALYLKVPLKPEYLLPMLPFALMLLGISLKKHGRIILLLILIQFSYNLINFNIAHVDNPNNATTFWIGLWVEWGYLITDVFNRLKMMII